MGASRRTVVRFKFRDMRAVRSVQPTMNEPLALKAIEIDPDDILLLRDDPKVVPLVRSVPPTSRESLGTYPVKDPNPSKLGQVLGADLGGAFTSAPDSKSYRRIEHPHAGSNWRLMSGNLGVPGVHCLWLINTPGPVASLFWFLGITKNWGNECNTAQIRLHLGCHALTKTR